MNTNLGLLSFYQMNTNLELYFPVEFTLLSLANVPPAFL